MVNLSGVKRKFEDHGIASAVWVPSWPGVSESRSGDNPSFHVDSMPLGQNSLRGGSAGDSRWGSVGRVLNESLVIREPRPLWI